MPLTDEEMELIRAAIKKIETVQEKYDAKVNEINEVRFGLQEMLKNTPKNIDCTDMTDEQVQTSKTNLLTHAQTIIDTW